MATVASLHSSKISAELDASPAPDYAGDRLTRWTLTIDGESAFQDVDQWGNPYDGSPASDLHDDLCEVLGGMGRLDADAISIL